MFVAFQTNTARYAVLHTILKANIYIVLSISRQTTQAVMAIIV